MNSRRALATAYRRKTNIFDWASPLAWPVILVCAGYYLGGLFGKSLRFPFSNLSLIWPPTAILLAALLVAPTRVWWVYLAALTPVHVILQLLEGVPIGGIASQLFGNFSQAVIAAAAVRHFSNGPPQFNNFYGVIVFAFWAALFSPILVSSLAAYLYVLSGWEDDYTYAFRARVFSNVLSTLAIVPALLSSAGLITRVWKASGWRLAEGGLLAASVILIGTIAFRSDVAVPILYYTPLPLLIWAALRFRVAGLSFAILITAYMAFRTASSGQGLFAMDSPAENVLSLQLFLITLSVPLLFLAALTEERKDKEKAMRESEARYRALVMASADTVWRADRGGKCFFAPQGWQPVEGENGEMSEPHWLAAVHPDDCDRCKRLWEQAYTAKRAYEDELRIRMHDGSYRYFHVNAVPVLTSDGNVREWVGTNVDITDRKLAEEALRSSEEHLRLALEAGRMGVWAWNQQTNTGVWSREHYTIMGMEPFSVKPSYEVWSERVHPDDLPKIWSIFEEASTRKSEFQCEYRIIRPDGTIRWVESRAKPMFDENDQCVRIVGIVVDITKRKNGEEALCAALKEVHRLKEQMEAENVYLREEVSRVHRFGEIVCHSEAMLGVLKQAEQVAPTDTAVLLLGETGTGKELLARAVHARSKRSERPLVKVNCAALPATLIESELFGHERGAFTGAGARRVGRFELADGATIFLDEIGDLPLELQTKLLRVLQEGEFERLGNSKTMKVNVRVIAATNRDLRRAVQEGKFREDLYYRLNVYPINLPPLRERREDIVPLALDFLRESSRRLGKSFSGIQPLALETLQDYEWPGNVRELQNVIERAALVSVGRTLRLPEGWALPLYEDAAKNGSASLLEREANLHGLTLKELERNHMLRVLKQAKWRVEGREGAATVLGLNPSTLRSRMNKLGIRR